MNKKFIYLIIVLFTFNSCGYTPLYLSKKIDFNIEIESLSGNQNINQNITNLLKKFEGDQFKKKIFLKIHSQYNKIAISKNSTGTSSDFRLSVEIIFDINQNEQRTKLILEESMNIKRDENQYEEIQLENILINNLTNKIYNNLINKLVMM